jgi:bla regulator protein blaR1
MHELVHIKRGDHLVRLLEMAVSIAFWWLPGVGWIGRQLRACEERCCDAVVVSHLPQARQAYARLLLDVVDFANPLPPCAVPQATAMSVAEGLEQRLVGILNSAPKKRRTWPGAVLAAGLAFAILPCGLCCNFVGPETPAANVLGDACEPNGVEAVRAAAYCCPHQN